MKTYKKRTVFAIAVLLIGIAAIKEGKAQEDAKPPKLVVGIVVDQMRYDYIYKYWDLFSENGFKKMVNQGFFCKNAKYDYVPTYTGPGHASIYTGATPAVHGICANAWFDKTTSKAVNCVYDSNYNAVGAKVTYQASPNRMVSSNVADELKLSTNSKAKVISISLKDRGAILPAGHMADGAYWYEGKSGNWITSSFYQTELPKWVSNFNQKNHADTYLDQIWKPMLPIEKYALAVDDNNKHEVPLIKGNPPAFPYDLKMLKQKFGLNALKTTPWGNTLTADLAMTAIDAEKLGADEVVDLLMVSFSSTDYVGHQFGPHSLELADTYIRLDKDIERLIAALETKLGKQEVLFFLTADHGAVNVPSFLEEKHIPSGYVEHKKLKATLDAFLSEKYGVKQLVATYMNNQIYFDDEKIKSHKLNKKKIVREAATFLTDLKGVTATFTAHNMMTQNYTKGAAHLIQNGYYPKRSGDVCVVTAPAWINESSSSATTHGSSYNYDTHVPLLWYGWKVQHGSTVKKVNITDIAPTLSIIMNTSFPNSTMGNPIKMLLEQKHK